MKQKSDSVLSSFLVSELHFRPALQMLKGTEKETCDVAGCFGSSRILVHRVIEF